MTLKEYVCYNCGSIGMRMVYNVEAVPVHSCVVLPTKDDAQFFPRGDVALGFCEKCGFISNNAFNSKLLDYSTIYEDQQCFSSTFTAFANDLVTQLIKKYDIQDKDVLEIGCGKGDFLTLLCELGNNRGVGIDPAYAEDRSDNQSSTHITFIRDYYSEQYAQFSGDFICCRHTLEHIQQTATFLRNIRNSIGNRQNTIVFFEVPDVTRILTELAFWDIYYEHSSYFSPRSIANLFRSCRFEIVELSRTYGDQYLLVIAKPVNDNSKVVHKMEESLEALTTNVDLFAVSYHKKIDSWYNRLEQIGAADKRAVIWGSGSKCVAFLTTLKMKNAIEYIVDINPHRHGMYLPSIGKKIMPPNFLKQYKPDITLIMNPIYRSEIQIMLENMCVSTEVIVVE
jgi:2-polyprenyl-3-methyl-5-hydroxy-6-metoxy-1,4-benzoquinol methylase